MRWLFGSVIFAVLTICALILTGIFAMFDCAKANAEKPLAATIFGTVKCNDGQNRLVAIEFYEDGRMRWIPAER